MSWNVVYEEGFPSADGRWERLFILRGPTFPCCFYVGPGRDYPVVPRFNDTSFYHHTEDEALVAFIAMKNDLTETRS